MKKMMKNVENRSNTISIISWGITIVLMCTIWCLSLNDMSFRMAWNDTVRTVTSESVITMLHKAITCTIIVAGSTNLVSSIIRKLTDEESVYEDDDYEYEYEEIEEES